MGEWDYIVRVVLVEGENLLSMDDNGLSDPYVRFRLQNEKYKTKVIWTLLIGTKAYNICLQVGIIGVNNQPLPICQISDDIVFEKAIIITKFNPRGSLSSNLLP